MMTSKLNKVFILSETFRFNWLKLLIELLMSGACGLNSFTADQISEIRSEL